MKKYFLLYLLLAQISCTHLNTSEREDLRELQSYGIRESSEEDVANPLLAGGLNLLPGFGNFYLAVGNGGESYHYLYGTLNLLAWPISILWGVPEAIIDANTINQRDLIYYYKYSKTGKRKLASLKRSNNQKTMSDNPTDDE
ncbi:MAG: hypothetical protein EXR74_07945 [Bdellovibrionales bacterium]|nr:hypothetical protein [Bdellovibrionales bacterium]